MKTIETFWRNVLITDSCWLWTGVRNNQGYGRIGPLYVHRVAYQQYVGELTPGMYVCHKCDTPLCVNPKHLFLGTAKENMQDCVSKGRIHSETHCPQGHLYGVAKMTKRGYLQKNCLICRRERRKT